MTGIIDTILNEVRSIQPYDDLERAHINNVLAWVSMTDDIFRISKPDNPPKHLVSYFVIYDKLAEKILLIDHLKANAWLPSGGHVDPGEDPRETVIREAQEELKLGAVFDVVSDSPIFVTVTETKPPGTHTDVSLWYVISGDSAKVMDFDESEMRGYKWFSFEEILAMDIVSHDLHMKRFTNKFRSHLSA